ncbi:MAG: NAD(P)-dependent oxidoreductase [Phycisphaeraceae bacterium]
MAERSGRVGKVLVTGAGGAVGRPACAELARRGHSVHGLDRQAEPPADWAGDAWHVGDVADGDVVRRAMAGMEAVVHLAATPDDAPFLEQLLEPNVVGLFNVMDAARQAGVKRVVLASSMQVVSGLRAKLDKHEGPLRTSDGAAPTNHYALTKVWAEQMGEMYARTYEMSVIAARIGWLPRNPADAARLARRGAEEAYLSWNDAGRFFADAVEAEGVTYAVLFAVSAGNGKQWYDRETPRQVIGYEARDRFPAGLPFEVGGEE